MLLIVGSGANLTCVLRLLCYAGASLEAYEREVRGEGKRSDQRYEHALYTLHRCDYDVEKARIHLMQEPYKVERQSYFRNAK